MLYKHISFSGFVIIIILTSCLSIIVIVITAILKVYSVCFFFPVGRC